MTPARLTDQELISIGLSATDTLARELATRLQQQLDDRDELLSHLVMLENKYPKKGELTP